MKGLWKEVAPLVRRALLGLAAVVLALVLAFAALWGVRQWLFPDWQRTQAALQAAQAEQEEARAEESDVQNHLGSYQQLLADGLVGGEPRAPWVEDLLATARDLGLQERLAFTLAAPETIPLPEAEAAQAQVQRHVLEVQLRAVHDIEALQFLQALQARHPSTARLVACTWEQPTPQGLSMRCRVNFLHIDPTPVAENNAS